MRPRISEFSYGYAVTESVMHQYSNIVSDAPIFPSLRREGQNGGGFDVQINNRIGYPLFLQFKLSHKMVYRSAREIRERRLFSRPPFFRMHLRSRYEGNQHEMLVDLDDGQNNVFYIAPYFYEQEELNTLYTSRTILDSSYLIRPQDIGYLPDDKEHHIASEQGALYGFFLSDSFAKKTVDIIRFDKFDELMKQRLLKENEILSLQLKKTVNRMLHILKKYDSLIFNIEDILYRMKGERLFQLTHYISRFYFDCELLLVLRNNAQ